MYQVNPSLRSRINGLVSSKDQTIITREEILNTLFPNETRWKKGKEMRSIRKDISITLLDLGYKPYCWTKNNRSFIRG
jgi:hypothetical protein